MKGLTPEEDAELRRLTWLSEFGQLGEVEAGTLLELRSRDRRTEVREPEDVVISRPH